MGRTQSEFGVNGHKPLIMVVIWQGILVENPYLSPASSAESPQPQFHVAWDALFAYSVASTLFALPYLLIIHLGEWTFFRNWLRCICGPTSTILQTFSDPINALWPHAVTVTLLAFGLTAALWFTKFGNLPGLVHFGIAFVWCLFGFISTLAI